jgi:hypothetical protein
LPAVEAYRRRKPGVVSVFIAHQREGEARRSVAGNFRGNIVRKIGLSVDAAKADCVFRPIAITDSSGRRSSNPVEGDHGFRSKAITHSSDRDQHGMTG